MPLLLNRTQDCRDSTLLRATGYRNWLYQRPRHLLKSSSSKPSNADSDSTDIEFLPSLEENSDSEGEEEDDGDDVVITNEIAASLPRKLASKRKHTKEVSRKLVTKLM
ncbi:hypothetical protein BDQ17DRAFT_1330438 [Cyathus striatus]|nr:hypothetical protein BDQ17DRAFT_1330438 [Cyathus striatus]